jgi:hypothetical protein
MDAICQVSKKDVLACVKDMNTKGITGTIFQVGDRKYHGLDRNRDEVNAEAQKLNIDRVIGMDDLTLHTKKCGRAKGKTIKASIIEGHESDTGLTLCRCIKRVIARRK